MRRAAQPALFAEDVGSGPREFGPVDGARCGWSIGLSTHGGRPLCFEIETSIRTI